MENEDKNHTSYCRSTWYDQKGNTEIPGNVSLAEIQKIVLLIFLEDLVKSYLSKQNNYNILYNY